MLFLVPGDKESHLSFEKELAAAKDAYAVGLYFKGGLQARGWWLVVVVKLLVWASSQYHAALYVAESQQ
jgi:hypothetical protein